jgi:hypothetical protein
MRPSKEKSAYCFAWQVPQLSVVFLHSPLFADYHNYTGPSLTIFLDKEKATDE